MPTLRMDQDVKLYDDDDDCTNPWGKSRTILSAYPMWSKVGAS